MSGHSKWATTHRQKEAADAKRGAIFTKFANIITIAARQGGDPAANPSLRAAIDRARAVSMPKDNIERAIKKGTGELAGAQVEELFYEGVLPGGVQVVIKCLTDNKNRSAAAIRHFLTKNNGSLGTVLWNFEQMGVVRIPNESIKAKKMNNEALELELIDQGVLDFSKEDEGIIFYTSVLDLQRLNSWLEEKGLAPETSGIEYVAKEKLALPPTEMEKIEQILASLEDNEDVSEYYTNLNN